MNNIYYDSIRARILVNDKPIKIYFDEAGKKWIEARENTIFKIEVKNNTSNKILSVISVDGLNIINGRRAELEPHDGYIVYPYSNVVISGWRISQDEVREFEFSKKHESYAAKLSGSAENVGVIGFAYYKSQSVYDEWLDAKIKYIPVYPYPYWPDPYIPQPIWRYYDTNGTSAANYEFSTLQANANVSQVNYSAEASSQASPFEIGTSMGEKVTEEVTEETFKNPIFLFQDAIFYDSKENLIKRGIIKKEKGLPEPFRSTGFCPEV